MSRETRRELVEGLAARDDCPEQQAAALEKSLRELEADFVLFDQPLSPSQQRNLERALERQPQDAEVTSGAARDGTEPVPGEALDRRLDVAQE